MKALTKILAGGIGLAALARIDCPKQGIALRADRAFGPTLAGEIVFLPSDEYLGRLAGAVRSSALASPGQGQFDRK